MISCLIILSFGANAIHQGRTISDESAVVAPIYTTSTYRFDSAGGFDYVRVHGSPNRVQFENTMAKLEGGKYGM